MSEIVMAVLAVAIAAQVAIMAKAGKDFLNSGLSKSLYGRIETGEAQQIEQDDKTDDSARLESETEIGYTYRDDKDYDYEDDENEEENFKANIGVESSLRLPL